MNHEWPRLEKVKAYAKRALTGQLAQGNARLCLEALEEEWELNRYKKEKPWKGKPVSGQASSKGGTEERPWSGIAGCISGCNLLITSKEKTLCRRSVNYCFQLLVAVMGGFSSSRPQQGKTWVIGPEACYLTRWLPQGSSEQSILATKLSQTKILVLLYQLSQVKQNFLSRYHFCLTRTGDVKGSSEGINRYPQKRKIDCAESPKSTIDTHPISSHWLPVTQQLLLLPVDWVQNHGMKVSAWHLGLWNDECSTHPQKKGKKSEASTGLLVEPGLSARLLNMFLKKDFE